MSINDEWVQREDDRGGFWYFLKRDGVDGESVSALNIMRLRYRNKRGWYVTHDDYEHEDFCLGPFPNVKVAKVVYLLQISIRGWEHA